MKYEDFEVGKDYLLAGDKMTLVSKTEKSEEFILCFAAGGYNYNFYIERGQSVSGFELCKEFEVGKFYRDSDPSSPCGKIIFVCTEVRDNELVGHGINGHAGWSKNSVWFTNNLKDVVEATEEEWVEALSKLAVEKGLIEGTRFISPGGKDYGHSLVKGGRYTWGGNFKTLAWTESGEESGTGVHLMEYGDWAKPTKTFEAGKLYESELGTMYRCTKVEDGKVYAYGFSAIGTWFDERVIQAPIEHLKDGDVDKWGKFYHKEKNKRYSVGDTVVCLSDGRRYEIENLKEKDYVNWDQFCSDDDSLYCSSISHIDILLSEGGKWAKVVKSRKEALIEKTDLVRAAYRQAVGRSARFSVIHINALLDGRTPLELTLEEIAEKFGVNADQIKIKK